MKVTERSRWDNFKIHIWINLHSWRKKYFLGHIVTADRVKGNPENIKAIKKSQDLRLPNRFQNSFDFLVISENSLNIWLR